MGKMYLMVIMVIATYDSVIVLIIIWSFYQYDSNNSSKIVLMPILLTNQYYDYNNYSMDNDKSHDNLL